MKQITEQTKLSFHKPKIVIMSYARTKNLKLYVCKDKRGWYYSFSLWSAINFYAYPGSYKCLRVRTRNLDKEIAMRLAVSNLMRVDKQVNPFTTWAK